MMRNDSNYSFPLISAEEAVQEVDVDQKEILLLLEILLLERIPDEF